MKPKLKPPGTKRLRLKHDGLPSNCAFELNLRRYTEGQSKYRMMLQESEHDEKDKKLQAHLEAVLNPKP